MNFYTWADDIPKESLSSVMESLQDMLLEHVVPDQIGLVGKIQYKFTDMKIVQVHWPKVTNENGIFLANNGALRLQGNYDISRPGVLGYHKSGEFIFDLSAICLTIRDHSAAAESRSISSTSSTPRAHQRRHQQHHERHRIHLHDVTCTVGHIKVKFIGGAARLCQFLTSLYIKVYRRHLEAQISKVIQETVQDDGQMLLSALTVMSTVNGRSAHEIPPPATPSSAPPTGQFQRFFDSFSRTNPNT